MKRHTSKKKVKVISCEAPDAQVIYIAGTFNDWNPEATPLKRASSGKWSVRLNLEPGRYEYRLIVDGVWCCEPGCEDDPSCSLCVPNGYGSMNRILNVSEKLKAVGKKGSTRA